MLVAWFRTCCTPVRAHCHNLRALHSSLPSCARSTLGVCLPCAAAPRLYLSAIRLRTASAPRLIQSLSHARAACLPAHNTCLRWVLGLFAPALCTTTASLHASLPPALSSPFSACFCAMPAAALAARSHPLLCAAARARCARRDK